MEPAPSPSQTASTDMVLPLRALQSRRPQLTDSNLKNIPDSRRTEDKKSTMGLSGPSTSLFSQKTCSIPDPHNPLATLVHPSPPQTPKAKQEWEDGGKLDSVPWVVVDKHKRTHPTPGSLTAPKRRCSEADGDVYTRVLPGMDNILNPQSKKDNTYLSSNDRNRWLTPSSSPEPSIAGESICSLSFPQRSTGDDDLITRSLNALRRERGGGNPLPPLPHPIGFGDQSLPSIGSPTFCFQGVPSPSPPREYEKRCCRGKPKKKVPHINVKYTTEELDFIRYHRVDRGLKWNDVKLLFKKQFSKPGLERSRQGIQGGYYRENNGQVPVTTHEGNVLSFLPNGHVRPSRTKVREQMDKKLYGLAVLFPERAMNYPWIDNDTRQIGVVLGR